MFGGWRLQLREAEEAFRAGRLDEAEQLLSRGDLRRYLPGQRLSADVASQMAQRARRRVLSGESAAGWRDLQAACRLGGETESLLEIKNEIARHAFREVERALTAGDTTTAIERIESLKKQQVNGEVGRALLEVARRMESARTLCRRGRFAEAEDQLASAAVLRPDLPVLDERRTVCREQMQESRELADRLHQALAAKAWADVLALADRLLELSPESPLAQDARRRAWHEVGAAGLAAPRGPLPGAENAETATAAPSVEAGAGQRFLLWVDGVGGYLVCLSDVVTLGQAIPGSPVDVPIQANLSRQHARIRRADGYVLEPLGRVRVDGQAVDGETLLSDGDEIELGDGVRLRFRQPHALSATARLEFVSRHRTQPSADAVLLMAESCVLGPKWQDHIVCRDWTDDVVLYRRDADLYCRAKEPLEIDGRYCEGQARVDLNSHVVGTDFSLSLEEIDLQRKLDKCCHKPLR